MTFRLLFILLACAAAMVAMKGVEFHPLDVHETYVVRTANEMLNRHDWVVPYFNEEVRLNKPPLAYWAAGAIAALAGSSNNIEIWHARMVSALAGIVLLLLLVTVVQRLQGKTAGLIAGGMAATSMWFFSYTHDARVDMLYTLLIFIQHLCFVALVNRSRFENWQAKYLAPLMWFSIAFAVLAKGPHIPGLFLVGHVIYLLVLGHGPRQMLQLFRPLTGLFIVLVAAIPWWLILLTRLGDVDLNEQQVSGTLLVPALENLLNPYYFLKLSLFLVPWLPLSVYALFKAWVLIRHSDVGKDLLMFLFPTLLAFLGLSLGVQVRQVYILPLMPLISAMMGMALAYAVEDSQPRRATTPLQISVAAQSVITVILTVWFWLENGRSFDLNVALLGVGAIIVAVLTVTVIRDPKRPTIYRVLGANFFVVAFLWSALSTTPLIWGEKRFDKPILATAAREVLEETTPVAAYQVNEVVFVYYLDRQITPIRTLADLRIFLDNAPGHRCGLLTIGSLISALSAQFEITPVASMKNGSNNTIEFVFLENKR